MSKSRGLLIAVLLLALAYAISPLMNIPLFAISPVVLAFFFLTLLRPEQVSLLLAWAMGLIEDILFGSVLGEHALSLTVVVFICLNLRRRMVFFPLWQQALIVAALVFIDISLVTFFEWLQGHHGHLLSIYLPVLVSSAFWLLLSVSFNAYYASPVGVFED